MIKIAKLITGGQSGVDNAALIFSRNYHIPYGGWTPRNGWAEDNHEPSGVFDADPELQKTGANDPRDRTQMNVDAADATLVVLPTNTQSAGTQVVIFYCDEFAKPYLVTDGKNLNQVLVWLDSLETVYPNLVLNVTGPRNAESPTAFALAYQILEILLASD